MDALIVGLLFFIPGVIFLFLVIFKYTKQEHEKELEKWTWFREDRWKWVWDPEFALFTKIAEKSFIITKIIFLILALILVAIGIFALWAYFL